MCGGGSSKTKPAPTSTYTPDPNAVADTSNDYAQRRAAISSTDATTQQPSTFGAELGG